MRAARLDYDIAVVGGGLVGACAAALLARHAGLGAERVVLIDSAPAPTAPSADAPPQLRVVAISRASERVLQAADAWSRVNRERLCAYERMRVWHETATAEAAAALCFDAAEIGEPNLGYIGENAELQTACLEGFRAAGGQLLHASLRSLAFEPTSVRLVLQAGGELRARLVVGADGADSLVRREAHVGIRSHDYRQLALVARVRTGAPHQHTAWQCFLRTGPLALLPLFDGSCSLVWSLDDDRAVSLRDCPVEQFTARLDAASGLALGRTELVSERLTFPLRSVAADSYVAVRCALIGDAAHLIHPLAGQGANLGLLDAAALCEAVAAAVSCREDPGALRALRAYEQRRRTHNLAMDTAMSLFQRLFALSGSAAALLVNPGLGWVNRSASLKRWFARQALGVSSELPRFARAAL